jgi:PAS domain S-box-containing protein
MSRRLMGDEPDGISVASSLHPQGADESGASFRQTVERFLGTLAGAHGWQAAVLWVPDHHEQSMICAGVWVEGSDFARFADETADVALPIESTTIGRCWRSEEAIWIADVETQDGFLRKELVVESTLRTVSMVPVVGQRERLGVVELLGLADVDEHRRAQELTEGVLRDLTGLMETQLTAQRMRVQQDRLDLALAAGNMGVWEWDRRTNFVYWSTTLEEIHGYAPGTFPGTMEAYEGHIHPDDRRGVMEALQETVAEQRDHHVLHRMIRSDGEVRWLEGHGRPVIADTLGFIGLTGVAMDVTERETLVADLDRQVKLTAEALAERSRGATTLQRSLRPDRLPEVDGVDLASRFRPGTELVGGDFYDVFHQDDAVYLVLGDVCGQGASAAALTSLVRHAARGIVASGIGEPSEIVRRLNQILLGEEIDGRFVTLVLARLTRDTDRCTAEICRAGHPLPLLRRRGHPARLIAGEPGAVIGVYEDPKLTDQAVDLHAGDVLVLYSDGITEARLDDKQFGERRLLEAVDAASDGVDMVADHILEVLDHFDRGLSSDDVALLVVGRPLQSQRVGAVPHESDRPGRRPR